MNQAPPLESAQPAHGRKLRYFVMLGLLVMLLGLVAVRVLGGGGRSILTTKGIGIGGGGVVKTMSFSAGPVPIEVTPELAGGGWQANYLGTGSSASSGLFYHRETRSIKLSVTRDGQPGDASGLSFTAFDDQDDVVESGRLPAAADSVITIDFNLNGEQRPPQRILIRK
jgi:hypothetical protein